MKIHCDKCSNRIDFFYDKYIRGEYAKDGWYMTLVPLLRDNPIQLRLVVCPNCKPTFYIK